jgi:hypothetical protein
MKNISEVKLKSYNYKLKLQSKQLMVAQELIKRSNGFGKTQKEFRKDRASWQVTRYYSVFSRISIY